MTLNVPMNEVKKVVYKGDELNIINIAGCTWKKPYTLTVSVENPNYIGHLNLARTIQSTVVNEADAIGWNDEELGSSTSYTYPILYEDVIDVYAEGAYVEGRLCCDAPQASASGAVTSKEFTGDQSSQSGRFIALGDCTLHLSGVLPNAYTLTISKGTGVSSVSVNRYSSLTGLTGYLSAGATIYAGDKLNILAYASEGYAIDEYTAYKTVSGNTTISITATKVQTGWTTLWNSRKTKPAGSASGTGNGVKYTTITFTEEDLGISMPHSNPIRISGYITGTLADNNYNESFSAVVLPNYDLEDPVSLASYTNGGSISAYTLSAEGYLRDVGASWEIAIKLKVTRTGTSTGSDWSVDYPMFYLTKVEAYVTTLVSALPGTTQTLMLSSGIPIEVRAPQDSEGDDRYNYSISSDLDIHSICDGAHWGYNQIYLAYGPGYTNEPIDIYEFDAYSSSEMQDALGRPSVEAQVVEEYGTYLGSIQLINGYWHIL